MVELLLLILICMYIPIGDILLSMVRGDVERLLMGGPFMNKSKMWLYFFAMIFWPFLFLYIVFTKLIKGEEND